MDDALNDPNTTQIIERLASSGWERTGGSEALHWANLLYDSSEAELEVEYLPGADSLSLRFTSLTSGADDYQVSVEFDGRLSELLDLIVDNQNSLSSATWKDFTRRLANIFPRSFLVVGEDEDDVVPLNHQG